MEYFTADTHYNHKNISSKNVTSWSSGFRDFDSLEHMNKTLVKNINDTVGEDDTLYHLGDFTFGGLDIITEFRSKIKCKNIHLILGNHDVKIANDKSKYSDLFLSISEAKFINIKGVKIYLSHYSHQVWNESHRGSLHLFGHSHGNTKGIGKSMDVGVDTHKEFKPYSFEDIIKLIK